MHDRRLRVALAVLTLLGASLAAGASPRYAGRGLADVLEELRADGLRLIYSTDLVRPGMKVREEPRGNTPRLVLDEVLAPHGLVASPGPEGLLVVVKRPPAKGAPDAAAGKALQLGFEERFDVPGTLAREGDAAGSLRLGSRDVLGTPGAIDNIFRALQVLPGITGAGFFDTRLSVRGGAPDQNLTVMDGVEIHNPFRLFGAVAGFNPETVARFELMAGAFPAQYGDRLSSLLVVETRDGRGDERFTGAASASVTDASAVLEGSLPGPGNGSWLFASRRTYYDLVAERILSDGLPQFGDLQLKLAWRGGGGQRLAFTAWRSREGTDADLSDPADRIVLASSGANDLVALSFAAPIGRRAVLRGVASAYQFDETLELDLWGARTPASRSTAVRPPSGATRTTNCSLSACRATSLSATWRCASSSTSSSRRGTCSKPERSCTGSRHAGARCCRATATTRRRTARACCSARGCLRSWTRRSTGRAPRRSSSIAAASATACFSPRDCAWSEPRPVPTRSSRPGCWRASTSEARDA